MSKTEPEVIDLEGAAPSPTIVAPKVEYKNRSFTDKWWGLVYILTYAGFLSCGFFLVSKSKDRWVFDTETGSRLAISDYYLDDVKECCSEASGYLCLYTDNGDCRRLQSGNSTLDGDEGIFDVFIEAPEIIFGLTALTLAIAFAWILSLRFFAKPIVFAVEFFKVAVFIVFGIWQEDTGGKIFFFCIAAALLVYIYWARNKILFAAKVIAHSTIAMKENSSIFVAGILIKLLFAGNAALFVTFFSASFNVVEVRKVSSEYCDFVSPRYVRNIDIFICISYLWTILLFEKMRLSVIAGMVGSWHFHPEDKPSVWHTLKNIGPSFGTLSISALLASLAEYVQKVINQNWWSYISPTVVVTLPINVIMCCFGACLKTIVQMLTKFSVILHVFTGQPFMGSAKSAFTILSRHFKGGFVTELTSKSVLTVGAYGFSVAIAFVTWKWVDDEFDCGTLSKNHEQFWFILNTIIILFNVWYPVLGIYVMILINTYLQNLGKNSIQEGIDGWNYIWIPPLAACFVGSIAMMMFQFLSAVFLDTIDTLFLCFAIDKDNNVVNPDDEFASIVTEVPEYLDASVTSADKSGTEIPVAEAVPLREKK